MFHNNANSGRGQWSRKKNMLHNDKHIECKITNKNVNIYTNIIIMQLHVQNNSYTHDLCILGDAHKNLVVVDF